MIYTTHGVVNNYFSNKFCHRNFLDLKKFENYLKHRAKKYVALKEAFYGRGDVFTIDDATYAAYEAAKLLRNYGHEVTLFINPYYIIEQIDYWFLKLNYLLDHSLIKSINFQGREYPISSYKEKLLFRKKLKESISGLPAEEERQHILGDLFGVSIKNLDLPLHLKTINQSNILELHNLGVNIQNHGWTHRELKSASEDDTQKEINQGQEWIKNELGHDANFYSVPFGSALPSKNLSNFTYWFLLDDRLNYGFNDKNIYNRMTLDHNDL